MYLDKETINSVDIKTFAVYILKKYLGTNDR